MEDKEVVLTGPLGCQGDDPGRVPAADHHLPHHGRVAAPLPCPGVRGHSPVPPLARARSPSVHRQAGIVLVVPYRIYNFMLGLKIRIFLAFILFSVFS